jgi:hypothetical protein
MADAIPRDLLAQRFEDWYRGVSIDLEGDLLQARREAVEAMGEDISRSRVLAIVAFAHGRREFGGELIDWITEHGQASDSDFAPRPDNVEPRVMAACAIAHYLATNSGAELAPLISLSILSAGFRGYKTAAKSQNLSALARRQLELAFETQRQGPSAVSAVKSVNAAFREAELGNPPDSGGAESGLDKWLAYLKSATETLASRHDALRRSVARLAGVNQQGLDQVGWLLDDFCELGDRPWSQMKESAILVSGTELAEISPVPSLGQVEVMVRSTLVKAGRDPSSEAKVLDAINRAAPHLSIWPEGHAHQLLPIAAGIDAWREKSGRSGWRATAKELRGGGELAAKSEAEIADQAFREYRIIATLADG